MKKKCASALSGALRKLFKCKVRQEKRRFDACRRHKKRQVLSECVRLLIIFLAEKTPDQTCAESFWVSSPQVFRYCINLRGCANLTSSTPLISCSSRISLSTIIFFMNKLLGRRLCHYK